MYNFVWTESFFFVILNTPKLLMLLVEVFNVSSVNRRVNVK